MRGILGNKLINGLGVIGICGWGSYALQTAALDTRVKATSTMTMYDMSRVLAYGCNDSSDEEVRYQMRVSYNSQRTEDYKNGTYTLLGGHPEAACEDMPQFQKDYIDYYKTERGYHIRSLGSNGGFASTAIGSLINMHLLDFAAEIRTSVLMVHGSEAHSLYLSQDAYRNMTENSSYVNNKELMIVEGAKHTDLYVQMDVIPFDRLETFFSEHLAVE